MSDVKILHLLRKINADLKTDLVVALDVNKTIDNLSKNIIRFEILYLEKPLNVSMKETEYAPTMLNTIMPRIVEGEIVASKIKLVDIWSSVGCITAFVRKKSDETGIANEVLSQLFSTKMMLEALPEICPK